MPFDRFSRSLLPPFSFLVALLVAGCGDGRLELELEEPAFLSIERDDTDTRAAALTSGVDTPPELKAGLVSEGSFYLAIHRKALHQRYFLSSYLKQFHPSPGSPELFSLGTKVVTFEVQNGKVVMFDADDRKQVSTSYSPEVILDAYPVIQGVRAFEQRADARSYVLFDPAAGQNEFSVLGNINPVASPLPEASGLPVELQVAFLRRYRTLSDGVAFDKVFAGTVQSEPNRLQNIAGTLGISLRRYAESPGFQPRPAEPYFFEGPPRKVPNTGVEQGLAAHWHLYPGMKPIAWRISREVLALADDPVHAPYDWFGAIKRGIESWNRVFGYPVFVASLAEEGDSQADDEKNVLLVDLNPAGSLALGMARPNPNTGEIRGASVYLPVSQLNQAIAIFGGGSPAALSSAPVSRARLSWKPLAAEPQCAYSLSAGRSPSTLKADPRTSRRKVEQLVTELVTHEIGHTLGLRHNFKGSLVPPSSSVMDYLPPEVAILVTTPGEYDRQAIARLYGTGPAPSLPFCHDEMAATDPSCTRFDSGKKPLEDFWGGAYTSAVEAFLAGDDGAVPTMMGTLPGVLRFARYSQTEGEPLAAFARALGPAAVPMSPATPEAAARGDIISRQVFGALFLQADEPAPTDPALRQLAVEQLAGVLENRDGVRSFEARRLSVEVLHRLQQEDAFRALSRARDTLTAELAAATGPSRPLLEELHGRVAAALSPYFQR